MAELQGLVTPELRQKIVQYLLGRWQGDAEWFQREVGKPMSFKELLLVVQQHFPAETKTVLGLVLDNLVQPDPREYERREIKRRAFREFDIGYGWDLPPGVPHVDTLDSYAPLPQYPTTAEAKEAVITWLARQGPPLLTLAGTPGVGKSHLADAAASHLLDAKEDVLFRKEAGLVSEFQAGVRTGQTEDLLRAYSAVPWLVIDDFGLPATTDWSRTMEDRLVDARWTGAQGGLRTLITTNMLARELPARAASRLKDVVLARVVAIKAPDYRQRRGKGATR